MNPHKVILETEEYVVSNNLNQALEILIQYFMHTDNRNAKSEAIIIHSRLVDYFRKERTGVIEMGGVELNKIRADILKLIEIVQKEIFIQGKELNDNSNQFNISYDKMTEIFIDDFSSKPVFSFFWAQLRFVPIQ